MTFVCTCSLLFGPFYVLALTCWCGLGLLYSLERPCLSLPIFFSLVSFLRSGVGQWDVIWLVSLLYRDWRFLPYRNITGLLFYLSAWISICLRYTIRIRTPPPLPITTTTTTTITTRTTTTTTKTSTAEAAKQLYCGENIFSCLVSHSVWNKLIR